jgi:hypothetical protein
MKKIMKKILVILASIFLINWSQNLSSPEYCSGIINLYPHGEERVIDIKIGSSKVVANNKEIKVFRKPLTEDVKENDFIEYFIDLKRISKIETDQVEPIATYDKKEYVNIKITSPSNISVNCIIPKSQELVCKLKNTGWTASYPFNKIKNVIIEHCAEIQEASDEIKKSKEVVVSNLKRATDELENYTDKKIIDLKHRANNVLEDFKNSAKNEKA